MVCMSLRERFQGLGLYVQFFRVFRERILRVQICMGLLDSFRVWRLFLGLNDVFIVLFRLKRESSAYFYCLAVRPEEEREFCIWGLHGFSQRYYGSGLIVQFLHGGVCRFIGFLFFLERDFRVLGSQYKIFRVFRKRNLCVCVCMGLVEFLGGTWYGIEILWLWVDFLLFTR